MNFMTVLFFVAALGAYGASPDADSLGQRHIRVRLGYDSICTPGVAEGSTVYQGANGQQIQVSYFHEYLKGSKVEVQNLTTGSSLLVRMDFDKVRTGVTETLVNYRKAGKVIIQRKVTSSGPLRDDDNIGSINIWDVKDSQLKDWKPKVFALYGKEGPVEDWNPKISSLWKEGPATYGTIYTDENSAEVTRYIFCRNASEGVFVRVRIPYKCFVCGSQFEWGTETYGKSLGVEGAKENIVGQRNFFIPFGRESSGTPEKDSAYSCTIQ